MAKYDYVVAGAGLFGSTFAQQMAEAGKRVLVVERRKFVAGAAHCDMMEGIPVFRYGPHIFHTKDRAVWDYVNRFARFNGYVHSPVIFCKDGMFETPFNMNTYTRLWKDVCTPAEAMARIQAQISWEAVSEPVNLEEKCLKLMGRDLYEKLLQGYLEKQWGKRCAELPVDAAQPMAPRYTFDNRYFDDPWQGVPIEGYDVMVKRMLAGCDLMLETDFLPFYRVNKDIADRVIFTGAIDEYFRYKQGTLEYRSITYQHEVMDSPNWQGAAVILHPDPVEPYTRTIEHKHFWFGQQPKTVVTREFPTEWNASAEPCFPVNDEKNERVLNAYKMLAVAQPGVTFCGRLGSFRYSDMDQTVRAALEMAAAELK